MVRDDVRRVNSAAGWQTVGPSDDKVKCVAVLDVTVCRLLDALLQVKRLQQLRQTDGMAVDRVIDVDMVLVIPPVLKLNFLARDSDGVAKYGSL